MVGSRASPQGLLVFPPGAAEQNWRPCPQVVCEGSAQPLWGLARLRLGLAAAWPYPPSGTLVFCPHPIHTRMATELALDCHHPQHRRAPYALPPMAWGGCSGERRADTATRSRRMCVPSRLSPVPLCPVCTQMSMNAVRRTGGATKYATTSQAASTAPATAATSSPGTAGAAKVRLRPTEVFPACLSPPLPRPPRGSSPLALLQLPSRSSWQSCWLLGKSLLAVAASLVLEGRAGGRRVSAGAHAQACRQPRGAAQHHLGSPQTG